MNFEYSRQLRKCTINGIESKFMAKFDPLKSKREERKKKKMKYNYNNNKNKCEKKSIGEVFDSKGIHIMSGKDLCDCLHTECTGCFFRCRNPKCRSNKCGLECRQKRKYYYKSIEDQIEETKRFNEIAIACESDPYDAINAIHFK